MLISIMIWQGVVLVSLSLFASYPLYVPILHDSDSFAIRSRRFGNFRIRQNFEICIDYNDLLSIIFHRAG